MAKKSSTRRRSTGASRSRPPRKRKTPSRRARATAPIPDAQFVFRGTMLQRGTATFAEVPINENTAAVRIDEILHGNEIVQDFAGQAITVQLGTGQSVEQGGEYIFHTNGWLFGASLAVVCVAVTPATQSTLQRVRAVATSKPMQALRARANRAELVVSGQVTQVRQVERPARAPISEHDPDWRDAVVRVQHVARGSARTAGNVVVRFAGSRDVRWAKAPKFTVGEEGVFMLGDKSKEGAALRSAAKVPKDRYLVVESEDFVPKEHAARVLSQLE